MVELDLNNITAGTARGGDSQMRVNSHDPETCNRKVFFGGVEISNMCYEADDQEGWAKCYKAGPDGKPFIENGELMKEQLFGEVKIV